jgi:hypothetical protein
MQRKVRDLQEKEVLAELKTAMRRVSRKMSPDDFLDDVSSNGLLVERERGLFSFAHHTFQEFLAASHIREKGMVNTLADNVDDIWWRETTLLYTARSDADLIVQACLKSGSVTALSLAFDCAEQDSELDPDLRESLENIIKDALAPGADESRRNLAAAVLVTRHLRHLVRAGSGGRVCTLPITNKIYHLFRQQVPGPMPDGTKHFEPDDNPILGVRQVDSTEFARWASQTAGGEQDYRLPSEDEINQPAVQRAIGDKPLSTWLATAGALWISPAAANPLLVDGQVQAKYVENDILRLGSTLTRIIVLCAVRESHRVAHKDAHQLTTTLVRSLDNDRNRDLGTALDLSFTMATHAGSSDWTYALMVAGRVSQLLQTGYNNAKIEEVIELAAGIQSTDAMSDFDYLLGSDSGSMYAAALQTVTEPDCEGASTRQHPGRGDLGGDGGREDDQRRVHPADSGRCQPYRRFGPVERRIREGLPWLRRPALAGRSPRSIRHRCSSRIPTAETNHLGDRHRVAAHGSLPCRSSRHRCLDRRCRQLSRVRGRCDADGAACQR